MANAEGLASKLGHWSAVYAAYLFLAGWSYIKFYFHVFGIDSNWLELGLNDTIAEGFSVLFGAGYYLSMIYLFVFLVSVGVEVYAKPRRWLETAVALALVFLFPATFFTARRAGIQQADNDRGKRTSLPTVTFSVSSCDYKGKLVYLKGELLFIYRVSYLTVPENAASCSIDVTQTSEEVPQVWIARSGELKDMRVTHYQEEAKP